MAKCAVGRRIEGVRDNGWESLLRGLPNPIRRLRASCAKENSRKVIDTSASHDFDFFHSLRQHA